MSPRQRHSCILYHVVSYVECVLRREEFYRWWALARALAANIEALMHRSVLQ